VGDESVTYQTENTRQKRDADLVHLLLKLARRHLECMPCIKQVSKQATSGFSILVAASALLAPEKEEGWWFRGVTDGIERP